MDFIFYLSKIWVSWTDILFSDIVLKVRPLVNTELAHVRDEGTLISLLYPAQNQDLIKKLAEKKVNAFGE